MDAQADLSLCWAHMPFCQFCHEAAQFVSMRICICYTKYANDMTGEGREGGEHGATAQNTNVLKYNLNNVFATHCTLHTASNSYYKLGMRHFWFTAYSDQHFWFTADSDQSLNCPHEETIEHTGKTLLRLGGCPG